MSFLKLFGDWFRKKDESVIDLYIKKEKESLQKEYNNLIEERKKMRDFINRLDALIDVEERVISHEKGGKNYVD